MFLAIMVIIIGAALWFAGHLLEKNKPTSKKGYASLPGCLIVIIGVIGLAFSLSKLLGLVVFVAVGYGGYRLVLAK
jgi:hypothetical protein